MNTPPQITVVIPTYERRESVGRILDALSRQTLSPSCYEVVVAIDGSEDGTRELLEGYEAPFALRSIWQQNKGRAAARNAGIRAARGALIVFLDDDMEPVPGFLEAHCAVHADAERKSVLGAVPIACSESSPPIARYMAEGFASHLAMLAKPGYQIGFRDFYSGNFSIRLAVLLEVGLFDESFRIYGNEDGDLALRLLSGGVVLAYGASALAYQHYEKDFGAAARDSIEQGRTAVLCGLKYPNQVDRLVNYQNGSRKWRLLRAGLLGLSRLIPRTADGVILLVRWLESRLDAHGRKLWGGRIDYYGLVLNYFFWLGAKKELDRHPQRGSLPNLWST